MMFGPLVGATPLDDFLAGGDSSTDTAELLQRIGLIGSLLGITLATGLIVFLVTTHRGSRSEVTVLIRVAMGAGVVSAIGASVEIAGSASLSNSDWGDALTDSTASAAMMRLLAGVLVTLGLLVGTGPADVSDQSESPDESVRWTPSSSAFGLAGLAIGVLSFAFDGHTVTEGPRVLHAMLNTIHVAAGGVWFGGVVALAVLLWLRRRQSMPTASLMIRFSPVASVALIAVASAGVLMSLMITDDFGDFTGTDWGRRLIIKTAAVGVVVAIGAYNHFRVVPALELDPQLASMTRRARTTVTIEAIVLTFVAVFTVFLTVASTN